MNKLLSGDGIKIAGHKISYGLLAVILGVPVAFVAFHQLQGGGVSAGDTSSGDTGVFGTDQEAAIANLTQQISDLGAIVKQNEDAKSAPGPTLNQYGYDSALWKKLTEHQKEYWKLHHRLP